MDRTDRTERTGWDAPASRPPAITRREAVRIGAFCVLGALLPGTLSACGSSSGGTGGTGGTGSGAGSANVAVSSVSAGASSSPGDALFSFFVVSDSHITGDDDENAEKMRAMLADIGALDEQPATVAVDGDITDSGYMEQYRALLDLVDGAAADGGYSGPFLWILGNHDQYTEEAETEDELRAMYPVKYRRFADVFGLERHYYDTYVEGYHFIALAPVNTTENWGRFNIPDEELQWLDGLLEQDAKTAKPVFVFMHEPIDNTLEDTFEGSWAYGGCATDPDALRECIEKYPFVVFFSGHTHAYPHYAIHDETGPLYAHDGCVKGTWKGKNGGPSTTNGLQVKVYEDAVEIRTRVFSEGEWDDAAGYRFERSW